MTFYENIRDVAVAIHLDGRVAALPTATRFEILAAQGGVASLRLTRFCFGAEIDVVEAATTFVTPPDADLQRLSARIGKHRFITLLDKRTGLLLRDGEPMAGVYYSLLSKGIHLVSVRPPCLMDEIEIEAEILVPLCMMRGEPRLIIPMRVTDIDQTASTDEITHAVAVLIGSAHAATLLNGRPMGDGPLMIRPDTPIELTFPEAMAANARQQESK